MFALPLKAPSVPDWREIESNAFVPTNTVPLGRCDLNSRNPQLQIAAQDCTNHHSIKGLKSDVIEPSVLGARIAAAACQTNARLWNVPAKRRVFQDGLTVHARRHLTSP